MIEWQPIESAPKDATPVLLYQPEHKREAPWRNRDGSPHVWSLPEAIEVGFYGHDGYGLGHKWCMPDHQCGGYEEAFPTHWASLQPPGGAA